MPHENFRFQKLFRRVRAILDSGETTFARLSWRNDIDVYTSQPYLLKTERFMIMDVGSKCSISPVFSWGRRTRSPVSTSR